MDKHSIIVGLKQQGFQCSLKPTCISSALDYSSILLLPDSAGSTVYSREKLLLSQGVISTCVYCAAMTRGDEGVGLGLQRKAKQPDIAEATLAFVRAEH